MERMRPKVFAVNQLQTESGQEKRAFGFWLAGLAIELAQERAHK
jgi:hypothetical protein